MKDLVLKVPGKTFFAGEYLALLGGPTLVAATEPHFEIRIRPHNSKNHFRAPTFHPSSPAGKLYRAYANFFEQFLFGWRSPYGSGGFGASTAEFIALHALLQMRETLWIEQERHFDLHQMLKAYRSFAADPQSRWVPSGADLVAQVRGGINFFENRSGQIQTFAWPFGGLGFAIVKTGVKQPTHEHLQTLGDFKSEGLRQATEGLCRSLRSLDEEAWIDSVNQLSEELKSLGFVAPLTEEILSLTRKMPVLAAKGCGALGADVIVVFYKKENAAAVRRSFVEISLEVIATDKDVSGDGLTVFVDHSSPQQEILP
jgi:mevalonate kinase